ncbi:ATPase B chain family protein [Paenibacillus ihumii]|uniref:ATPase B chain family protein n=1 Tax=Paenibacillus ihumii TaxID=687436 RepID=UPI001E61AF83|nr:ATPase B chain family protein [Paenibacillus ihumii]
MTTSEPLPSKKKRRPSVKIVLLTWILLISAGVTTAYMYSNHLKQSMLEQLDARIQDRTDVMKADYTTQLAALSEQVEQLNSKVETFNELLTFTKDNASDKTDNSNKLYSQLNEVKNQLAKLQKQMDLLK